MNDNQVSVMGRLVRDVMRNMMDSAVGHKFQTGEYRMDPREPAWLCPSGFEYEIVGMEHFKMEYLRPVGVCTGRVVLQLHGGGYIGPMKNIYRDFAVQYSLRSKAADVLTPDYRVAPEHPFPAALEDAVAAYRWLLEEKSYEPERIVVAGDSAGGGLSLGLIHYLKDHGIPLPAGVIVMSPWTDVTCSGASYQTNFVRDPQFGGTTESMLYHNPYIGDANPRDPYLSPLFGDFTGFPPVLIQVGSEEMLLDDSLQVAGKLRRGHVRLRLSVYEGMFHVFQMAYRLIPESRDAWEEVSRFMEIIYGIRFRKSGRPVRRVKSGRKRSEQP
ncbi:MAG: alpha/beta hydrolase [Clostridiales bacterium]|nr:alpha/beta hydrolase [Clostridiales bacterium]